VVDVLLELARRPDPAIGSAGAVPRIALRLRDALPRRGLVCALAPRERVVWGGGEEARGGGVACGGEAGCARGGFALVADGFGFEAVFFLGRGRGC
jgi:hypothetical protein